jgi:hypothetical protein
VWINMFQSITKEFTQIIKKQINNVLMTWQWRCHMVEMDTAVWVCFLGSKCDLLHPPFSLSSIYRKCMQIRECYHLFFTTPFLLCYVDPVSQCIQKETTNPLASGGLGIKDSWFKTT